MARRMCLVHSSRKYPVAFGRQRRRQATVQRETVKGKRERIERKENVLMSLTLS